LNMERYAPLGGELDERIQGPRLLDGSGVR